MAGTEISNADRATVAAAAVVGLLCDAAGVWCGLTDRVIFGALLIMLASIIATVSWRFYFGRPRP